MLKLRYMYILALRILSSNVCKHRDRFSISYYTIPTIYCSETWISLQTLRTLSGFRVCGYTHHRSQKKMLVNTVGFAPFRVSAPCTQHHIISIEFGLSQWRTTRTLIRINTHWNVGRSLHTQSRFLSIPTIYYSEREILPRRFESVSIHITAVRANVC